MKRYDLMMGDAVNLMQSFAATDQAAQSGYIKV